MALLKVMPGDIVAIPAKKGDELGFVLSRVISDGYVLLIEVFRDFYTDFSILREELLALEFSVHKRLFAPVKASFDFNKYFGKVKWPILLSNPDYNKKQSEASKIEFCSRDYLNNGIYYKDDVELTELPGVRRNLNDGSIYSNPQLMMRVNLHLSNVLAIGEPWNVPLERRLLDQYGEDWYLDYQESFIPIADEIAQKLKEAQAALKKKQARTAGRNKA